jgi:hypothetical protein
LRFQSFAQLPLTEIDLIYDIADRAFAIYEDDGQDKPLFNAFLDIATCHAFCCPLRLRELRDAGIEEFVSDVLGIKRHLEPKKRVLRGGFLPRYSASTEVAA